MSIYLASARFAQVMGLIVAAAFGAIWIGAQTEVPIASGLSRAFAEAGGSPRGILMVAALGFAIFLVATALFAVIGDVSNYARNMRDLRSRK